jgi:hypothetical protein
MKHKRRAPESKYRPTRTRKLTLAQRAEVLPRELELAFREAKERGKQVPDVFIEEDIVPLAVLTRRQREGIDNAGQNLLKAADWGKINRSRLEYFWRTREDDLGVTTAAMAEKTTKVFKAARKLLDVVNINTEADTIVWTRLRDIAPLTLPPGIIIPAFDFDSIYPIITQFVSRAHLVCEVARADHRAPLDYSNHWHRFVEALAGVFEAHGWLPTAGKPKYGGDPNPPQSEFVKFVSAVWSTLPKDVCTHPPHDTPTAIIAAVAKSLKRRRR